MKKEMDEIDDEFRAMGIGSVHSNGMMAGLTDRSNVSNIGKSY